jgi:hypothetical protein
VLGGTVGAAMTPSETENAKEVVRKVCEDIPLR